MGELYVEVHFFFLKHKTGQQKKIADVLSRRAILLVTQLNKVINFECLKELYAEDEDFTHIWDRCNNHHNAEDFLIQDGYLFKDNQLCVP